MAFGHFLNVYVFSACCLIASHLVSLADGKCGRKNLRTKSGEIKSPKYPNHYPSHSQCSWLIQVPLGHIIKLQFLHFELEGGHGCGSDVLKAFDGPNISATLLGKYCDRRNDFFTVTSTSNVMLVTFNSDRSLNYGGFRATFTALPVISTNAPSIPIHFKRAIKNTTIAVVGDEVKFHCPVIGGSSNVQIKWSKDGKMLDDTGPSHSIKHNTITRKSFLTLTNVSKSDEGLYGCWAIDISQNISMYGSLQVKEPATITDSLFSRTWYASGSVLITCQASGDPVPRINWLVNGINRTSEASQKKYTSTLNLTTNVNVTVNCTCSNDYGVDWKAESVIVVAPPPTLSPVSEEVETFVNITWPPPVITKPPADKAAELGDNVTLICAAEGNPKPTIRWLADGDYYENVPQDENGTSYFTFTLKRQRTSVRCEAQNPHGIDKRTVYVTAQTVETIGNTSSWIGPFGRMTFIVLVSCAAVAAFLILFGFLFLCRRHNMKFHNFPTVPVDVEKLQNNPIFQTHASCVNPKLVNWEVPRNQMEFIKDMGPGNGKFTQLFLGKISQIKGQGEEEISLVIVKLLKEKNFNQTVQEKFGKDALSLTLFNHANVQSLFGICAVGYPLCLVFKYSEHDECLHRFLNESGRNHCSIHRRGDVENSKPKLSNVDQMCIAKQIANGMQYLAEKGYIHKDLCTKNCIIGKGMVVKISNLGFSWTGPDGGFYSLDYTERPLYPLRWLPPETIQFGTFVEDTDIWSFGIVLWEIYSNGLTPYYGMSNEEVISLVQEGDILPCPQECPKEMYEIMEGCWNLVPSERPRFSSIHQRISSLYNGVPV